MKFVIKHEIRGRIRVRLCLGQLTVPEADLFYYYLCSCPCVREAKGYERTAGAGVGEEGDREKVLEYISRFSLEDESLKALVPKNSGRALNQEYKEKLIQKVSVRVLTKFFLPSWARAIYTTLQALKYIAKGIRCLAKGRLEVEVLDATAVTVSIARLDFNTAGSIMFLLGVGELLEEWTHKKSVGDLARSMSLHIEKVWLYAEGQEVLVPIDQIREGDLVSARVGSVIPLDGIVEDGEAMVNQASMTGESIPVRKEKESYVYAGTAVEEGALLIRVKKAAGSTRFERIVSMIEESEKLKSSLEGKAENLADALVPWSLGGTALTWLLTGNTTKALSTLMVDF